MKISRVIAAALLASGISALAACSEQSDIPSVYNEVSLVLPDEAESYPVDTVSIPAELHYNGDGLTEYIYGSPPFTLEKLNNGVWQAVKFSDDTGAIYSSIGYTLSAKHPVGEVVIPVSSGIYAEPLTEGRYRFTTEVYHADGTISNELSLEFTLKDRATPTVELVFPDDKNTFSLSEESITAELHYLGDKENDCTYGSKFTLEKLVDGEWEAVKFKDGTVFQAYACLLGSYMPVHDIDIPISSSIYAEPLTAGIYRYAIGVYQENVGSADLSLEFTLKENYIG